jgi:hypothetical protein
MMGITFALLIYSAIVAPLQVFLQSVRFAHVWEI